MRHIIPKEGIYKNSKAHILEIGPKKILIIALIFRILYRQLIEAIGAYLQLLSMKESLYMKMGNRSIKSGKYHAALGYFREELRAHPQNVDAIYKMGWIKMQQHEYALAMNLFQEIIRSEPEHKKALEQIQKMHDIVTLDVPYIG